MASNSPPTESKHENVTIENQPHAPLFRIATRWI
jgi:hypothetical protein